MICRSDTIPLAVIVDSNGEPNMLRLFDGKRVQDFPLTSIAVADADWLARLMIRRENGVLHFLGCNDLAVISADERVLHDVFQFYCKYGEICASELGITLRYESVTHFADSLGRSSEFVTGYYGDKNAKAKSMALLNNTKFNIGNYNRSTRRLVCGAGKFTLDLTNLSCIKQAKQQDIQLVMTQMEYKITQIEADREVTLPSVLNASTLVFPDDISAIQGICTANNLRQLRLPDLIHRYSSVSLTAPLLNTMILPKRLNAELKLGIKSANFIKICNQGTRNTSDSRLSICLDDVSAADILLNACETESFTLCNNGSNVTSIEFPNVSRNANFEYQGTTSVISDYRALDCRNLVLKFKNVVLPEKLYLPILRNLNLSIDNCTGNMEVICNNLICQTDVDLLVLHQSCISGIRTKMATVNCNEASSLEALSSMFDTDYLCSLNLGSTRGWNSDPILCNLNLDLRCYRRLTSLILNGIYVHRIRKLILPESCEFLNLFMLNLVQGAVIGINSKLKVSMRVDDISMTKDTCKDILNDKIKISFLLMSDVASVDFELTGMSWLDILDKRYITAVAKKIQVRRLK